MYQLTSIYESAFLSVLFFFFLLLAWFTFSLPYGPFVFVHKLLLFMGACFFFLADLQLLLPVGSSQWTKIRKKSANYCFPQIFLNLIQNITCKKKLYKMITTWPKLDQDSTLAWPRARSRLDWDSIKTTTYFSIFGTQWSR